MRIKIFSLIMLLFLLGLNEMGYSQKRLSTKLKTAYLVNRQKPKRKDVKIWFLDNKNDTIKSGKAKGVYIFFTDGFDSITNITLYLNNKVLKKCSCQTNYSINRCLDSSLDDIGIYVPYDSLKENSYFRVTTSTEYIIIKIPLPLKSYAMLEIYKNKLSSPEWNAKFFCDRKILILR